MYMKRYDLLKTTLISIAFIVAVFGDEVAEARHRHRAARPRTPIQRYGEIICNNPGYHCYTVGVTIKEMEVKRRGKVIIVKKKSYDNWKNLWPDEREREIVMKLNRMSIGLRRGMIIAVPDDMTGKTYMDFSPYPQKIGPPGEKLLTWDPALMAWAAYNPDGSLLRWGPGVGGRDYCPDIGRQCRTMDGTFRILKKGGRSYRSSKYPVGCGKEREGKPKIPCATMPWYVRFEPTGGGFHGSPNVVGYNASHGCVRCFTADALWLNQEFAEIGTLVVIKPYPTPLPD